MKEMFVGGANKMKSKRVRLIQFCLLLILCLLMLGMPAWGAVGSIEKTKGGPWWVTSPEPEVPSQFYDSILYSEIAPRLRQIQLSSSRVQVEVIGQSAGGRDLYLVTVSDPKTLGRLGHYQALRRLMITDPEAALEMIDRLDDFKVPIFINGSIHGNEYPGTDAVMRLIETLAYSDSPEVQAILSKIILLVNVVQNPDGRVLGTRANANGIDVNRDFITQSQPETRATVQVIKDWNPMVILDLHGFVSPMLIEPCTPPHNPNYEYDLYITWAYQLALAMEAELYAQTGYPAQIPFLDQPMNWDDWPPTYTPMYGMFHGGYGHTLETPYRDERGVNAHFAAVWGALKFSAEHQENMLRDQIEIFRRGFLALPQMLIPDEILDLTKYDQFNELTIKEFPAAYIIPKDMPLQLSAQQPHRLVQFLLDNDVQVEQAVQAFSFEDVEFPAGTYIVWMDQPKRGLANTILEAGLDLSGIEGLSFYSPPSVWSNPLLWGTAIWVMPESLELNTIAVKSADLARGWVEGSVAGGYAYSLTSLEAFQATNELVNRGVWVARTTTDFEDQGRAFSPGTIVLPADPSLANELASHFALSISAFQNIPVSAVPVTSLRVAVSGDAGLRLALERLGFQYNLISAQGINTGELDSIDVFINQSTDWSALNRWGQASYTNFVQAGGHYIGLLRTGVGFALSAGISDATFATNSGNTIVRLRYDLADPLAAGFNAQDYAFVYYPLWFTYLGTGEAKAVATFDGPEFVVSGYWPGWQTSGAEDMPVVLSGSYGDGSFTLVGIDATFRVHPENTFRLIGNAIYEGLR
jgi:hypothetical protein